MKPEPRIGVFRPPKPSQVITRSDMLYWIAEQKRHDAEKDQPDHHCDFCPVKIIIPAEQINDVQP
jgi:hypothetical protein